MRRISQIATVGLCVFTRTPAIALWIAFISIIFSPWNPDVSAKHEPCHHDEAEARREGQVVVFTTVPEIFTVQISRWIREEKPDIKVTFVRYRSDAELLAAIRQKSGGDVVLSSFFVTASLKREGGDYPCPQERERYPATENRADREGSWTAFVLIPRVIAYNASVVPVSKLRNLQELVSARDLPGKIMVPANDVFWFYGVDSFLGKEKFRSVLADIRMSQPVVISGATPMLNALAAREGVVALAADLPTVLSFKERGAPIDYLTFSPVVTSAYALTGLKTSSHPNAGREFMKILLAKRTQEKNREFRGYVAADKLVESGAPKLRQEELFIPDPAKYLSEFPRLRAEYRVQ